MSARVLVVDDQEPNVRLLEAKLKAEYFEVVTAFNGLDAISKTNDHQPDVILLDIMMPGMDGFEVCRKLKADRRTRHIPIVMVTALDQPEDRVRGLEAGADDFLTKPVDNLPLFARIRSLLRLKVLLDELRVREDKVEARGLSPVEANETDISGSRQLIITGEERIAEHLAERLPDEAVAEKEIDPAKAVSRAADGFDLIIVDLTTKVFDALRVCARIRSNSETRHVPILAIVDPDEMARSVRALDLGVNDIVNRPVDRGELNARIRTQLRRKRYADMLRERLDDSLEMAVTDPLTGLSNRRYLSSRLEQAVQRVAHGEETACVMIADLDYFKRVNDSYGHDAGDAVLQQFAECLRHRARAVDLVARFGGEEFVVLMPSVTLNEAAIGAERLRATVNKLSFRLPGTDSVLAVTVSIGLAEIHAGDTVDSALRRADEALYRAKAAGRNCVKLEKVQTKAA
ncbi:PleD family two-component system response regulator [Hyphobacterium sp.]|uniref:PleD family two-component system response regulator n=1 Tax=Hyphobacterium sp. TaxID=2004662 RepID=UPI003BAC43DB